MQYEMPDGSWDMEREEADSQLAALAQAGRDSYQMSKRSLAALLRGDKEQAANFCPHSWRMHDLCLYCGARVVNGQVTEVGAGPAGCPRCAAPLQIDGTTAKCGGEKGHEWALK